MNMYIFVIIIAIIFIIILFLILTRKKDPYPFWAQLATGFILILITGLTANLFRNKSDKAKPISSDTLAIIKSPATVDTIKSEPKIPEKNSIEVKIHPNTNILEVGVLIVTYEEANERKIIPGIFEAKLLQKFTDAGFVVKNIELPDEQIKSLIKEDFALVKKLAQRDDIDYILVAEIRTTSIPKTGPFLFANATGVVKIIDIEKKNIIVSCSIEEKGAGLDETQAAENALRNVADSQSDKIKGKLCEIISYQEEQ